MTPAIKAEIMKHCKFYGTGESCDHVGITVLTVTKRTMGMDACLGLLLSLIRTSSSFDHPLIHLQINLCLFSRNA